MKARVQPPPAKSLTCAIYTRVSSDAGLEQEFNSLDSQREAAEAHILSQKLEGWRLHPARYDDGGISGGTMERPALQRLLADVRAGAIDIIVVYKVDRLTRSLADFAKLVELFDAHGVSFVSVTQSFNTTTSMGRLTLNVLLSFAQFEREVTGERIRDKIAASKKKGMWMGGNVPLGYRVENRRLLVEPGEAEAVRTMFRRYLELRSVPELATELRRSGFRTRKRELADGRIRGGVFLTHGPLRVILKNRIYIGGICHRGITYEGEHEPIVERELFDAVQAQLAANAMGNRERWRASGAILLGKIRDDSGNRMTPAHADRGAVRYLYYVSCAGAQGRPETTGSVKRVSAPQVEGPVLEALRKEWRRCHPGPAPEDRVLADDRLVDSLLDTVTVHSSELRLALKPEENFETGRVIVIPWRPLRNRRRRAVIAPSDSLDARPIRAEARARLLTAIARARRWVADLEAGTASGTAAIALAEHLTERSVRMTLPLAFLSPAIIKAAVDGTLPYPAGVTALASFPDDWSEQLRRLAEL